MTGSTDRRSDGNGSCPKCGHGAVSIDGVGMTGAGLSKLVEHQRHTFSAVVCEGCGYTEFYSDQSESRMRDLFFGREPGASESPDRAERKRSGDLYHCSMCGEVVDEHARVCSGCDREFVDG